MGGRQKVRQVDSGVAVTVLSEEASASVDRRLEVSGAATVGDLLQTLGHEALDELRLVVHDRTEAPTAELRNLSIAHGDELRVVRPRRLKQRQGRPIQATYFLRQDDGRERGVLYPVPVSGLRLSLDKGGESLCRTKVNFRNPRPRRPSSMLLVGAPDGVRIESDDQVTVDGEPLPDRSLAREGSIVRLASQFLSPDGAPWEITFVVVRGAAAYGTGWVPYRVVSEGKSVPIALDESAVRLPSRPAKPVERSDGDLAFELLPGVALAVLMFVRGGSNVVYGVGFLLVYAARIGWQVRQRSQARDEYEDKLRVWERLRDRAVDAFSGHVLQEASVRSELLEGALSPGKVWKALNRMPGLWTRGVSHPFFLQVRIGIGRWRSSAVFPIPGGLEHEESTELIRQTNALRTIDHAPVAISLLADHCAIVGKSTATFRVINLVLADVAVNHSPLDVRIFALLPEASVPTDPSDVTVQLRTWLKWLPHVRTEAGVLPADRVRVGRSAAEDFLIDLDARFTRSAGALDDHPYVVGFVHESVLPDQSLIESLVRASEGKVRIVWCASNVDRVPALCSERVVLGDVALDSGAPAVAYVDSHLWGASPLVDSTPEVIEMLSRSDHHVLLRSVTKADSLLELARSLAPLADDRRSFAGAAVPSVVPLAELVPLQGNPTLWHLEPVSKTDEDLGPVTVIPLRSAADSLDIQLGVAGGKVLEIDLVSGGPHMLVGGTTGSGKSEFLASLIATTVARYDPGEVQLALIDFKGGAAFDAFSGLHHVVCEASNLEPDRMTRAIEFLNGELDYRMGLMRKNKAKDFEELRRRDQELRHPRLLVVLDEYAAAQQSFPEVRRLTDTIAARGRSLGVHVVFATQNPANAVTADMVTNIGARVCLRMLHEADAKAVVFDEAPARIPLDLRGRAFLRTSEGSLIEFQSPYANANVSKQTARVSLEEFPRV